MQPFRSVRLHLIAALSILIGCLFAQTSSALSLGPDDGVEAAVSLSGHLAVFYDSAGTFTVDDVASGRPDVRFNPIPSMLTQGYRKGAIWVRFSLSSPEAPGQWLLQIERPLIESVTLYVSDGEGHFVISPPGDVDPGDADAAGAYPALFPITVSSVKGEYYIRLQSSTSITTALNIWKKDGYENYLRTDDWIIGIVIGAIGAMIFANILYAVWLRDSLYLLYAGLLLISGLIPVFHMGYSSEIFHFMKPQELHRSWGTIVCL